MQDTSDTTHKPTHELHNPPLSLSLSLIFIYMSGTIPTTHEPTHYPLYSHSFLLHICHPRTPRAITLSLSLSYYIYVTHDPHHKWTHPPSTILSAFLITYMSPTNSTIHHSLSLSFLLYIYVKHDPHHKWTHPLSTILSDFLITNMSPTNSTIYYFLSLSLSLIISLYSLSSWLYIFHPW